MSAPKAPIAAAPGSETSNPNYQYHLGSGDRVRIITFGEASLTGEFVVSGSGTISLPLVGEIHTAGLTTNMLERAVEAQLRGGYLTDPKVSVEVMNYRPFYILGEVTKPGEYPYTNGLTVLNAVATANGFTYRADTKTVYVRHVGDKEEAKVSLTPTTPVLPGDTIRIRERYF